jgi:hypothetical protein
METFNAARIKKIMRKKSNADQLSEDSKENHRRELLRQGLKRNRGDYTPVSKRRKKR